MDLENAKVQMRKGILEFCILHIISRGEVYASDMLDELTSAKIMVVEGTLYPLLTRLKNSGLLDYKWVESVSGPPRKYYVLTDNGKDFLKQLEDSWVELQGSVVQIVEDSFHHHNKVVETQAPLPPEGELSSEQSEATQLPNVELSSEESVAQPSEGEPSPE
jgi:PadR family transcriptional regulator, regulatory protein PadR